MITYESIVHEVPAEPLATCGAPPAVGQGAYSRSDLLCEMMLWQSEQLGDGNKAEYDLHGCPWGGLTRGDKRKGGRLLQSELPSWAGKGKADL